MNWGFGVLGVSASVMCLAIDPRQRKFRRRITDLQIVNSILGSSPNGGKDQGDEEQGKVEQFHRCEGEEQYVANEDEMIRSRESPARGSTPAQLHLAFTR